MVYIVLSEFGRGGGKVDRGDGWLWVVATATHVQPVVDNLQKKVSLRVAMMNEFTCIVPSNDSRYQSQDIGTLRLSRTLWQ